MSLDDAFDEVRRKRSQKDRHQQELAERQARIDELVAACEQDLLGLFRDFFGRMGKAGNPGLETLRFRFSAQRRKFFASTQSCQVWELDQDDVGNWAITADRRWVIFDRYDGGSNWRWVRELCPIADIARSTAVGTLTVNDYPASESYQTRGDIDKVQSGISLQLSSMAESLAALLLQAGVEQ